VSCEVWTLTVLCGPTEVDRRLCVTPVLRRKTTGPGTLWPIHRLRSEASVSSFLSRSTLAQIDVLRGQFEQATPFRHVVIDDFLDESICAAMIREFPPFDTDAATNEFGRVGQKAVQEDVRSLGGVFREVDRFIRKPEFLTAIGRITGIKGLLYDPRYYGGGTHENRSGQSLDPHVDFNYHPIEDWHRRLNLIVYLNDDWSSEWGGSIDLHSDPWSDTDIVESVSPQRNRCVIFETNEHSWHGFRRIEPDPSGSARSRRSFAIYLYSIDRPSQEIVAPHTTHYVHRPLPDHLRPGYTLNQDDVRTIRRAVNERSTWIKYLYDRELAMSQTVEELRASRARWPALGRRLALKRRVGSMLPPGTRRGDLARTITRRS
jgi:Rps23 Pro-64 3,4-dihydroxylase Tpa1-like proline 4-hydroxylase